MHMLVLVNKDYSNDDNGTYVSIKLVYEQKCTDNTTIRINEVQGAN